MRVAVVILPSLLLSACSLYFKPDDPPSSGSSDVIDAGIPQGCASYTATIYEPTDGATVPRALQIRVRWNQPDIPDRVLNVHDSYGNYFPPFGFEVLGDGSNVQHYLLPANGSFSLDLSWICNGGSPHEHEILLARARFFTGAS